MDPDKTVAEKVIGLYLNRTKLTEKLISEYTYGVTGNHARAVPKRERYFNAEDVLAMCGFMRVVDKDFKVNNEIIKLVVLTLFKSFNHADQYYTYTLPQGDIVTADNNVLDADYDQIDDLDEVMEVEDENMPCFNSIT